MSIARKWLRSLQNRENEQTLAHGLLVGFCRICHEMARSFLPSLSSSFFHRECGDVPFLSCYSLLYLKRVFGKSLGQTQHLTWAKERLDCLLRIFHCHDHIPELRHNCTFKSGNCEGKLG